MDDLKKLKKDNEITEDDQKTEKRSFRDITDSYIKQSEEIEKKKNRKSFLSKVLVLYGEGILVIFLRRSLVY